MEPGTASLYDLDFFQWTARNAELLREGKLEQADILRIAEELEDMGKRERRALLKHAEVLLAHLLKWNYQPERQSRSWKLTMNEQRHSIEDLLQDSPSLHAYLCANLPRIYRRAVENAMAETGLEKSSFPPECPFTLEQILSSD